MRVGIWSQFGPRSPSTTYTASLFPSNLSVNVIYRRIIYRNIMRLRQILFITSRAIEVSRFMDTRRYTTVVSTARHQRHLPRVQYLTHILEFCRVLAIRNATMISEPGVSSEGVSTSSSLSTAMMSREAS